MRVLQPAPQLILHFAAVLRSGSALISASMAAAVFIASLVISDLFILLYPVLRPIIRITLYTMPST